MRSAHDPLAVLGCGPGVHHGHVITNIFMAWSYPHKIALTCRCVITRLAATSAHHLSRLFLVSHPHPSTTCLCAPPVQAGRCPGRHRIGVLDCGRRPLAVLLPPNFRSIPGGFKTGREGSASSGGNVSVGGRGIRVDMPPGVEPCCPQEGICQGGRNAGGCVMRVTRVSAHQSMHWGEHYWLHTRS